MWTITGLSFATLLALSQASLIQPTNPDTGLNVEQMILRRNYGLESHKIISDGYTITMQRVFNSSTITPKNESVLLVPGFLSSATDFANTDRSLTYLLADKGYDVWLGNCRGNMWARKHVTYNPDTDCEFWNFSFQEMAIKDLPNMIDYILKITGVAKLYLFGHSQGTTICMTMLAEKPEYNDKVKLLTLLAPAGYFGNIPNAFLQGISEFAYNFDFLKNVLGTCELFPHTLFNQILAKVACLQVARIPSLCSSIYFLIFGYDSEQLVESELSVIFSNLPASTSLKAALHLAQLIKSGKCQKYDYREKNNDIYGQPTPPDFDLTKVTAPVSLFCGNNDNFVSPKDVNILRSKLPNIVNDKLVNYTKFNHADFLFAEEVKKLLYDDVLACMQKNS